MYRKFTDVGETFLQLRQQVIDNRKPRKLIVQHVTRLDDNGNVKLLSFEGTCKVGSNSCSERTGLNPPCTARGSLNR